MAAKLLIALAICGCQEGRTSCDAVADHVVSLVPPLDDHARAIREVFAARCRTDDWSGAVRTCIADTTATVSNHCRSQMTPAQVTALDRDLAEVEKRSGVDLPGACADYKALLAVAGRCATFPADVRASLVTNLAKHETSWPDRDPREVAGECEAASRAVIAAAPNCFGN